MNRPRSTKSQIRFQLNFPHEGMLLIGCYKKEIWKDRLCWPLLKWTGKQSSQNIYVRISDLLLRYTQTMQTIPTWFQILNFSGREFQTNRISVMNNKGSWIPKLPELHFNKPFILRPQLKSRCFKHLVNLQLNHQIPTWRKFILWLYWRNSILFYD